MSKISYEKPEVNIFYFQVEDVITTSDFDTDIDTDLYIHK